VAVLNRVTVDRARIQDPGAWYLKVPAIAALAAGGIDLNRRVTVILGENGSGKSTFVEAVAEAWRSRLSSASPHWGPGTSDEDADLHWALRLDADSPLSHGGCFLRAEAMHGLFDFADTDASVMRAFGGKLNTRSHGESFLGYLKSRLIEHGLFLLDEPEAALSFASCLQLLVLLGDIADSGSQVIVATHSPVLAAFPGATLLEFSDEGIAQRAWDDLDLVSHWRSFMSAPQTYLRHLFD
jgi:predicted ATPase